MDRPSRWDKIKEIVGTALEHDPASRAAYLDEACAQNPTLRPEIESLINAYDQDGAELSQSPMAGPLLTSAQPLQSIGPYRLLKLLGEGGMGQVWLAEQTSPVRRQVALKLIRSGMLHSIALQRFHAERQSLAIMDHPCIAKVFDAGAALGGQPYFVMEYVEGLPITQYCDQRKLSLPDRLRLFIQVCDAVQHAHQKAIIHRDLKPANILVVEIDGKPRPRIIDFGIAKAAVPAKPDDTLFTQVGVLLGTPGYMSPEQIDPSIRDVDTRTDVYSLGVVLYELLTGSLPFDTQHLKRQPLDKLLRMLHEEDPPSPSTKVSSDFEKTIESADLRGLQTARLATLLRGDLDWITMKALERERDHRYGTTSELAADIERYLHNRSVIARPASTVYRFRKYIRRNRVAVAVASGALAFLIVFAIMQAVQLRRITRERDRANRITEFMFSMFKVADPNEARGNSITAREILDNASKDIDPGLARDPVLQAQMLDVMGTVYHSLGLYAQAKALLARAVEIRRRVLGPEHPDTLHSIDNLAWTLMGMGEYAEAEDLQRRTLDIQRRVLGPDHPDTARSINRLAGTLVSEGRNTEAEKLYRESLDIRRRILGPEHEETLSTMLNLSMTLQQEGRYTESENLQRETLDIQRRVLGMDHPGTLGSMRSLASALDDEGRFADAQELYHETLELDRRILGPEHPETLRVMHRLALTLQEQGRFAESEKLYRETLELTRRALGPEHPQIVGTLEGLALDLAHENRYGEAEPLFREAVRIASKQKSVTSVGEAWYDFACGEAIAGHRDVALQYLRKAVELRWFETADMANDDDLKNLRGDPRFEALVAHAKELTTTK